MCDIENILSIELHILYIYIHNMDSAELWSKMAKRR